MNRIQLALNVDDVDVAVDFYSKLFDAEPAKRRPGYANFAIAEPPLKLVLIENPGQGGSLNHLGIEVEDTDAVDARQTRLAATGLASVDERDVTCCYAKQDKFWVEGAPNGERWEVYTVLEDSATFGSSPAKGEAGCCGSEIADENAWPRSPPAADRPPHPRPTDPDPQTAEGAPPCRTHRSPSRSPGSTPRTSSARPDGAGWPASRAAASPPTSPPGSPSCASGWSTATPWPPAAADHHSAAAAAPAVARGPLATAGVACFGRIGPWRSSSAGRSPTTSAWSSRR